MAPLYFLCHTDIYIRVRSGTVTRAHMSKDTLPYITARIIIIINTNRACSDKTYNKTCATIKDQPIHSPSMAWVSCIPTCISRGLYKAHAISKDSD